MEPIEPVNTKQGKGKTVLIVLLLLLLGAAGFGNYWFWNQAKTATAEAGSKIDSLNAYHALKDSLSAQLDEELLKVESLRAEIAMYQSDNDSLKMLLDEKMAKIASLKAMIAGGGSSGKLRALKDSISRMRAENISFRSGMDSLLMQNAEYRARMQEQAGAIALLETQKKTLSEKVSIAAQPYVGPVSVFPVYQKKGVYTPIYKAKKVERLQISFDVLGNKLTEKAVSKEYTVRIMDPDGIVLSNDNSTVRNSDDVYTVKESVEFNGSQQKIKLNFTQKAAYKKGKYKVELKEGSEVKHTFAFDLM